MSIRSSKAAPLKPLEGLAVTVTPAEFHLLPESLARELQSDKGLSELTHLYPHKTGVVRFRGDLFHRIPFMQVNAVVQKVKASKLRADEKLRNRVGIQRTQR